jgi:hypothetical protein
MVAVNIMLDQLNLKQSDTLYDLGCGDARILIRARQRFCCKGVGIEIDPTVADIARWKVAESGCGGIRIVTGDATKYDLDKADAVAVYLFPDTMALLIPKITTHRIVSYQHAIPGHRNIKVQMAVGVVYLADGPLQLHSIGYPGLTEDPKPSLLLFAMW